ncbi:MAG: hypothetical protein LKI56_09030, partial [Clostridium sp.]|nr:hypothetical protein [Clostridium sp.]
MKTTANYGLKKPEGTDVVDIQNFNDNADIIDAELKTRALVTDIPSSLPANGGNSATATKLATARKINGVAFDGSEDITVTANPNAHTHTKSQITDFPSSLPANGGNATTVNNHTASGTPATAEKTDIVKMINELFTNVNNGKNSVYSAIVDKGTTPASKDFADLVAGISAINTGKKWASGTTSAGSQTSFEYADGSDTGSAYPLKLPITFEPSLVLAVSHVASYYVAV